MEHAKIWGRRIREARWALGISQADLAERLGVSKQAVQRWEAGETIPNPTRFDDIGQTLGVPWTVLFSFEEEEIEGE